MSYKSGKSLFLELIFELWDVPESLSGLGGWCYSTDTLQPTKSLKGIINFFVNFSLECQTRCGLKEVHVKVTHQSKMHKIIHPVLNASQSN